MKTVFIALQFHLSQTKSSHFFITLLKKHIPDITVVSCNDAWYKIPKIKPDTLIIWQYIYIPQEIDAFGAKNVIFIPMYDACPHTEEFWMQYKKYKVLCFSKTLFSFLHERGFDALYCQYWTEPQTDTPSGSNDISVFFWERSPRITWETVKKLLTNVHISKTHYHTSTNIHGKTHKPPDSDIEKYNIECSDWFESQEEYKKTLEKYSVYIAPREEEGIGLSFIEAMAAGKCVVAPDTPTMNEYISDSFNGYLYQISDPEPLHITDIRRISRNALESAKKGYAGWQASGPVIMSFILKKPENYNTQKNYFLYMRRRVRAVIRHMYKYIISVIKHTEHR